MRALRTPTTIIDSWTWLKSVWAQRTDFFGWLKEVWERMRNRPWRVPPTLAGNEEILGTELDKIALRRALLGATAAKPAAAAPAIGPEPVSARADRLKLSALCLSGGGIRSAAFAMGVAQGLAARKILSKFDYLSTVSGGGYTGAMLTAWVQRAGYEAVERELAEGPPAAADIAPLQHLRRFSSYLSPASGMLSTDMLTLVALYIRNLLLNWFVIIPIVLIAILILKLIAQLAWAYQGSPATLALFGLLAIACAGASTVDSLQQRPGWGDESSSRARFVALELVPMLIAGFLISVVAINILQQDADSAIGNAAETGRVAIGNVDGLVLIAGGTYFIAAILALSFSPPRIDKSMSTPASIQTIALPVAIAVVAALAASGAIVGYLISRIMVSLATPGVLQPTDVFLLVCLGPPVFIVAVFVAELIYCALTGNVRWGDAEREWLGRATGYHARTAIAWSLAFAVVHLGSFAIDRLGSFQFSSLAVGGGLAGLATSLIGKSSSTVALIKKGYAVTLAGRSLGFVLALSAIVFVLILTSILSWWIDYLILGHTIWFDQCDRYAAIWPLLILLGCVSGIAILSSLFVNTNRYSLHGVYRNRLIRAFLGASRANRNPNAFTNFDSNDNMDLCELWPNKPPDHGGVPPQYLVQNMAMNIVATRELAWQERKAMSFVATPLWCGCGDQHRQPQNTLVSLGGASGCYRKSDKYARGLSLGTGMTLSGAAASPNMGYHSSPALSVLLTFFNVRLGGWFGNPSPAGNRTYQYSGPLFAAKPMVQEALGLTDDAKSYVYLSDGGHFDNLGLYEMIRRRCRLIVVSDAGSDPDYGFEDLGNAVRKVSIDQRVEIEFRGLNMVPRSSPPKQGPYVAIASIKYPGGAEPGLLVYIKPNYQGNEPISVRSYALKAKLFPHESTTDQFFGESQFEAYRALGRFVIDNIDGQPDKVYADVASFVAAAEANSAKPAADTALPSAESLLATVNNFVRHLEGVTKHRGRRGANVTSTRIFRRKQ